ncbi:hypothetical protein FS749_005848 [Ceratobasidium sp. UAMH 11750]|nr:hypothetical protein FS749_005848 [Ceratobasidium sp. UAMH 11750]
MRQCSISCTPSKGRTWFTREEAHWIDEHVSDWRELQENEPSGAAPGRKEFYDRLVADYLKTFPYRDPSGNPGWIYTADQLALRMNSSDRSQLRNRMRGRLREAGKRAATPNPPEELAVPESLKGTSEQCTVGKDEHSTGQEVPADDSGDEIYRQFELDSHLQALGPLYGTTASDLTNAEEWLAELGDMSHRSWSEIEEPELRWRQQLLMEMFRSCSLLLNRATGAEIYASMVWHDGSGVKIGRYCTPRVDGFATTSISETCTSKFVDYVEETIGQGIRTDVREAAPTVCGDASNDMRPVLPPIMANLDVDWRVERNTLRTFLQDLWGRSCAPVDYNSNKVPVWQGGRMPVPWELLEQDGQLAQYRLIQEHRLPPGVICLQDTDKFDKHTTILWATALRSPERTGSRLFQFRQPAPGLVYQDTLHTMHTDCELVFPPEAILYKRRLHLERGTFSNAWGGLPVMPNKPVVVLSEECATCATEAAGDVPVLQQLIDFLPAYEHFGPYQVSNQPLTVRNTQGAEQATRADYEAIAHECEFINPCLPATMAGFEHFANCLEPALPGGNRGQGMFPLRAALAWIDKNAFMHPTGTLMGGPYGFKWQVLLLFYLISAGKRSWDSHQPGTQGGELGWEEQETSLLLETAGRLLSRIGLSVNILGQSQAQRAQAREVESAEIDRTLWEGENMIWFRWAEGLDQWTERDLAVTA